MLAYPESFSGLRPPEHYKQHLGLLPSGSDPLHIAIIPEDKPSAKTFRTNITIQALSWASAPPKAY